MPSHFALSKTITYVVYIIARTNTYGNEREIKYFGHYSFDWNALSVSIDQSQPDGLHVRSCLRLLEVEARDKQWVRWVPWAACARACTVEMLGTEAETLNNAARFAGLPLLRSLRRVGRNADDAMCWPKYTTCSQQTAPAGAISVALPMPPL